MLNSATIKSIQDIMRKDVGVDGDAQRIGQLTWMLFLKIYDDREQEWELSERRYKSPIPESLRWRNWAADAEGLTGEPLLEFVNNQLFRELKNLPADASPRHKVIHDVFEDAYQYMKSGTLLRQVINKLNESLDFNRSEDRHVFGDLYEQILKDLQSAGNAGEYYTPRAVTQFMVDMVNPQLGETVLDPACGTGGFLTCAIEHLRKQAKTADDEALMQKSVRGVEKKPLPHLLCVTNMLLHGIDTPTNIRHDNTLARPLRDYGPKDRVDCIITNPPFGGMEEDGIEDNFPSTFRTRETADLFLVLILNLLKPGGRAAIVLPDGTLFGEGVKTKIKEKLLTECNLHTIVRLPNGVFSPYTGIKTNLLFFTKGEPTKSVWYYEHPYPSGTKSYNKTKPIRIEEFDIEKKWWKKRKVSKEAWNVPLEQIQAADYNLDIKNPQDTGFKHTDPDELLADYRHLMIKLQQTRDRLKNDLFLTLADATRSSDEFRIHATRLRNNFDRFFDTPTAIQNLREVILQLAIQGRLVPQDASDAPASELKSQILTKRKQLADSGEFNAYAIDDEWAERPSPNGLPRGWEWIRLSELGGLLGGGTPSKERPEFWNGQIPWVSPKDMKRPYIDDAIDHVSLLGVENSSGKMVPKGSVLMVVRGMILAHSFPVALAMCPLTINQDMKALQLSVPEVGEYLLRCFTAIKFRMLANVERSSHGTCRLPTHAIANFPIPLPSLAEQKRIVLKLDQLLALCDEVQVNCEEATQKATAFVDSTVHELSTMYFLDHKLDREAK